MSGGSYNYEYCRFKEQYENAMFDDEMNDLVKDLADVLHDVEWWQVVILVKQYIEQR